MTGQCLVQPYLTETYYDLIIFVSRNIHKWYLKCIFIVYLQNGLWMYCIYTSSRRTFILNCEAVSFVYLKEIECMIDIACVIPFHDLQLTTL